MNEPVPILPISEGTEVETHYRTLFDNLPVGIFVISPNGRLLDANQAMVSILGYGTREALLAMNAREFHINTEDAARYLARLQSEGEIFDLEVELERPDGTTIWLLANARAARDANGDLLYYHGTVEDFTARKRAEESERSNEQRFHDLFESSPDAIFVEDLHGTVLDVNPAACRLHGMDSTEIVGRNIVDLVPSAKREEVQRDFPKLARGEITQIDGESVTGAGRHIPVSISASRIEYLGRPALLLHVRDMSDQQRLQEQFLQAQKMDAIGRLAGGVAHDFNNLLTAIIGYDEMLLNDLLPDDPSRHHAEEIGRAAVRATKLTHQLLAFSRKQTLLPRIIDLNDTVREIKTMIRRLIGDAIQLVTETASAQACVRADPGQIEQVLINLAVNARDAMPQGGQLTIRVESLDIGPDNFEQHPDVAEGGYVLLSVADTGAGMSEEIKELIFEPFFTTKGLGKGTGLGLATCHGIVGQSGGRIAFESELGEGTRFFFYLPRIEAAPEPAAAQKQTGALPRGHERILLVEDSPSVRGLAARVLRGQGYEVHEAENGEEALRVFAEAGPIDLLLTDVMMPQIGGKLLMERIRALRPDLRVMFNSGSIEDEMDLHEALARSRTTFLSKPFTPAELAQKVRVALDES